jgi:hypothetical protein
MVGSASDFDYLAARCIVNERSNYKLFKTP